MENIQKSIFKQRKVTLSNDKLFLIISLFLVLFTIYRNSWLPGGLYWVAKENFIFVFLTVTLIILTLDFNKIFYFKLRLKSEYFGLYLLFFLSFISVIINFSNEFVSLYNLIRFITFILYLFLYFFYLPSIIQIKKKYFITFIRFYAILGFWIGSIGLTMYIISYVPYDLYTHSTNYISLTIHPNYVSYLLTATIVASLYYFLENKEKFTLYGKIFYFISFIIQVISQILTISRGGFIGTSVGIFLMLLFYYRKKIFLIFPVIIAISYYFVTAIFTTKGIASNISRFLLLIPVYYMLMEKSVHTFFGFGITNSFEAYTNYRLDYGVIEQVNNPHNSILSIFIMFGIIFTICFLIFFFGLIIKGFLYSFRASDKTNKLFYGFLTSSLMALAAHGIFESALIMPEYFEMQLFLLSLGLLFLYTRKKNKFSYV